MSFHHLLIDVGLWFIAVLWLIGFLTDFSREHSRLRRIRKLGPPAKDCERIGDYEVHMGGFGRRQAD